MKILVLNGSPRRNGNTETHIEAFKRGAEERGHIVEVIPIGRVRVKPCEVCEYCHEQKGRKCRIDDDMIFIYPSLKKADMVVFASPVHYFGFSAQLQAMLSRIYCWHKLPASKYALILSSGSPDVFDGIIGQYRHIVKYFGGRDEGILTVSGKDNKSEETLQKMYEFGKSLKDPKEEPPGQE
ncbi:MAG: flavodoxin family protein [Anaerolineaceae bacterium]|nr:flavodoxin family protein [Anaerolineaceae bacterium]